jgi:putative ABC transport system ATP-binding protein
MPDAGAAVAGVAVSCSRLLRIYTSGAGETHALRGVDAEFPAGTVTAVTGPSGSGKSSLLAIVGLLERQDGGELTVLGRDVDRLDRRALRDLRRTSVARVPQRPTDSLYPHLTASEHLAQVARLRGASSAAVDRGLRLLGLESRADAVPGRLSGGEQQRLAMALAGAGEPAVLVADEPTAELDDVTSAFVLQELARCAAAGSCVLVATHDPRVVTVADRVLALRHGVLSTEVARGGVSSAAIDSIGRVQLPPEALALFPSGRAVVVVAPDGVRLRRPDGPPEGPAAGPAGGPAGEAPAGSPDGVR